MCFEWWNTVCATLYHACWRSPDVVCGGHLRGIVPRRKAPDLAFGSNIAGAVGGLAEACSMLLGFQHLLLLAMLFYLLSAWSPRLRRVTA